ncbi:MAG: CidA/LrgA family protein [Cellulosilyticaceae bacterium]
MNILLQIAIVFGVTLLGEGISATFQLPLPGNVLGMLLLLLFLGLKWIKEKHIQEIGDFFLRNMAFLFIPAGVSIVENIKVLEGKLLSVLGICIMTTIVTLVMTGLTAQGVIALQNKKNKLNKQGENR